MKNVCYTVTFNPLTFIPGLQAGYFAQVRNMKRSSQRLKEGLMEDDLAISLCILMAQERFSVVYKHDKATHLKLIGKLFDQVC